MSKRIPELIADNFILIDRGEAIRQGLTTYFTGNPCGYGHIDEIYVSNNTCRTCQRERSRDYGRKNIARIINNQRVRTYGITTEAYKILIDQQNNKCLCCEEIFGSELSPHLDHDHKTGKIRGVLCHKCNTGIGLFEDNPAKLRKAIIYLEKHNDLG